MKLSEDDTGEKCHETGFGNDLPKAQAPEKTRCTGLTSKHPQSERRYLQVIHWIRY